ncbi:MAG: ABC transporter substrate-binding protein [Nanobdellota archaeon]
MRLFSILCLVISIIIVSGCGGEKYNDEINIVMARQGFDPINYALNHNVVDKPEGIKINFVGTDYSQAELYTLSTKKPTIGILSSVNIAIAANKGKKFKILAPQFGDVVGPRNMSMGQLIVLKNSEINSVQDLKNKKIGIQGKADGSSIAMMTTMHKKYGADLDDFKFMAIKSQLAPELLKKGAIDAAMFDSDYILKENFKEEFKTLIDFGKDLKELYGCIPPIKFFVVEKENFNNNPELYKKTLNYLKKNYYWGQANLEKICANYSKTHNIAYDKCLTNPKYTQRFKSLEKKHLKVFKDFYKVAINRGVIKKVPEVNELFIKE